MTLELTTTAEIIRDLGIKWNINADLKTTEFNLEVSIVIETYIKEGSVFVFSIPKSNANMQQFLTDKTKYQYFDEENNCSYEDPDHPYVRCDKL